MKYHALFVTFEKRQNLQSSSAALRVKMHDISETLSI